MAIGWILFLRKIRSGGAVYRKLVLPVSQASYGMYLCHLLVLVPVSAWLREALGLGADGVLGIRTTPVQILLTALISYVLVALACVLVQRIPKLGRILIG